MVGERKRRAGQTRERSASVPHDSQSYATARWSWGAVSFLGIAALWFVVLMLQPVAGQTPRWLLFLVPSETFEGWIDGPVTPRGFLDRAVVLLVAALVLLVAWGGGRMMIRRSEPLTALARPARWALQVLLGLSLQSSVVLALGWAGVLREGWSLGVLVAAVLGLGAVLGSIAEIVAGKRTVPRRNDEILDSEQETGAREADGANEEPAWVRWMPRVIAILGAMLLVSRALLPPAEYDVREYHLQAPKEWWQTGRIDFMPHNIYANMPMAAESHAVVAMMVWEWIGAGDDAWWWGALSGKAIISAFAVVTAVLLGSFVRMALVRQQPESPHADVAARWTVALVLAFPALVGGAGIGLIESAVAAFLAAGMVVVGAYAFVPRADEVPEAAMEAGAPGPPHWRQMTWWLAWSAGGAMACKYPALVLVVPPLVILGMWALMREGRARTLLASPRLWMIALVAAGLAGGLWYAKNWAFAENPVYPLLGSVLGGRTLTPEKIDQWNAGHATPTYSLAALAGALRNLLWGWELQGWCAVPLAVAGAIGWRRRGIARALLVALVVVVALWWLLTHRIDRFMVPAMPLALALAGFGVAEVMRGLGTQWASGVLVVLVAFNGFFIAGPALGDPRLMVDLRYLRLDDRSASTLSRLPEHVPWINRNLSRSDRLLVVGDAAVFDYEVPVAYSTTFDRSPLSHMAESPPEQWGDWLRRAGFSHVMVHWGEVERLRATYGFAPEITPRLLERMRQAGAVREIPMGIDGVELYEVLPERL